MTKDQAINALACGKKVKHRYFTSEEFIYVDDRGYLKDEQGYVMGPEFWQLREGEKWDKDWYIID